MKEKWYKPYDSPEEAYTSWYLDELVDKGYVIKYKHQPESYTLFAKRTYQYSKQLKTKVKIMDSTLLQEHVYTPDFEVIWRKYLSNKNPFIKDIENVKLDKIAPLWSAEVWSERSDAFCTVKSVWEVKPLFDRNNMTRLFTINQKWMYDKYGIYVQKIIPQKLFRDTFTPKKYLLTDRGKQKRKLTFVPRTLSEYMKLRENDTKQS